MASHASDSDMELITTVPPSSDVALTNYRERVAELGRWSERNGFSASLVYSDNRLLDPWMVSQVLAAATTELIPLVAVQPAYMHPYAVANLVASLAHLHGRRTYLNMVAGGFRNDLKALNDPTPHDHRYDRLVEYTTIILELLRGETVTRSGDFYSVTDLKLSPALPPELAPDVFVSGSSEAGRRAADLLGARPVAYPKPPGEQELPSAAPHRKPGLRVGIIARTDRHDAWRIAHERFPPNRKGQMLHQMARKVSDSVWHRELSELAEHRADEDNPYWLVPFENYATMCPYLVGSHEDVARELEEYLGMGYRTFLVDIPREEEDLVHAQVAFRTALEGQRV